MLDHVRCPPHRLADINAIKDGASCIETSKASWNRSRLRACTPCPADADRARLTGRAFHVFLISLRRLKSVLAIHRVHCA